MFLPHATYRHLTEIPDSISTPVATVANAIPATADTANIENKAAGLQNLPADTTVSTDAAPVDSTAPYAETAIHTPDSVAEATDTTGVGLKVSDAGNLPAANDSTNRETAVTTPATSQEIVGPATADSTTAKPEAISLGNPSATKEITPTTTAADTTERDSAAYSGTSVYSPATTPATADTANIETKAAGTENLPAASDTLFLSTDSLATTTDSLETVTDSLSAEPPAVVIDIRPGLPAPLRPAHAPLRDDGLFVLLLAGLVLFLLSVRYRKKIFSWQSDGTSEHRHDSNPTKHLIGINAHLRNIFLAFTFIIEGTLGAIALHVAGLPLPFHGGYATNALLFALPAALYFLCQQGIFVLLTTLFSTDTRGREWCDTHIIINLLLGIALFPFAFMATYLPEAAQMCLICAIILYLLTRILFIIKGVKLFLRDFRSLLYFILYLCALETAPLLLMGKFLGVL